MALFSAHLKQLIRVRASKIVIDAATRLRIDCRRLTPGDGVMSRKKRTKKGTNEQENIDVGVLKRLIFEMDNQAKFIRETSARWIDG